MVNPIFSNRRSYDPDEEKEIHHEEGLDGPLSMTDDQLRQFTLRTFQPRKYSLLKTLGEKLGMRKLSLNHNQQLNL